MTLDLASASQSMLSRLQKPKIALAVGAIFAAFCYQFFLHTVEFTATHDTVGGLLGPLATIGVTVLLAASNVDRRYAEIWTPLRILMRGTGVVIFAQILFDALHPAAFQSNLFMGILPDARILIGISAAAGVIAMWRPSFLLPMFLAFCAFRFRVPIPFGFSPRPLDFTTTVDVGQFPACVLNVCWLLTRVKSEPLLALLAANRVRIEKLLWAVGVGVHVGNYFHSGLAKMYAGGPNPLFWVTHNPIQQAMAIGLFRMSNPLATWPTLLADYAAVLATFAIAFNIVVFSAQILSPLALLRRRWLIGLTLLFDAMHIGIYLSLGAFFFFWIALNVVILASLAAMSDREFSITVRATAAFCALVGFMSFSTATLGWLDGKKIVRETIVANMKDGRSVDVPGDAFGLYSYQLGHGDLFIPANHFPMRMGANVKWPEWIDGSTCGSTIVNHDQAFVPFAGIKRMVVAADSYYREHPWVKDWNLFFTYPHHMPSNPGLFGPYREAKITDVASYTYVVESACVEMTNGHLSSDIKKRSAFTIPIAR